MCHVFEYVRWFTKMISSRQHYLGIDLIRFAAAALVVLLHLGVWSWWQTETPGTIVQLFPNLPAYPELAAGFWSGWVGVQIFFVVSGFVIAMSAANASPRQFARARFLRLYPAAWICATVSFFVVVFVQGGASAETVVRYLNSLVLTPYPKWIDGVYWTLPVEIAFYGSVFLLLFLGGTARHLLHLAMGLLAISGAFIAYGLFVHDNDHFVFSILLLRHGVFFALGMLIWHMANRVGFGGVGLIAAFIGALVLGGAEIYLTAGRKLETLGYDGWRMTPVLLWWAAVAAIVASVRGRHWLNRKLARHAGHVRLIGLATYPLYLSHQMVGGASLAMAHAVGMNRWVALALALAACIGFSLLVASRLERPFRRAVAGLLDRRPTIADPIEADLHTGLRSSR